jgi:hypothetical protein
MEWCGPNLQHCAMVYGGTSKKVNTREASCLIARMQGLNRNALICVNTNPNRTNRHLNPST